MAGKVGTEGPARYDVEIGAHVATPCGLEIGVSYPAWTF